MTGGLAEASAIPIAWPAGRFVGQILGALVVASAVVTVLDHRAFSHLPPLGTFALLLALAAARSRSMRKPPQHGGPDRSRFVNHPCRWRTALFVLVRKPEARRLSLL